MIYTLTSYKRVLAVSAAVCVLAFSGVVGAKPTFTTFDPLNTSEIHVIGINNAGVIAGYYNDSVSGLTRGFLRAADGSFAYIDPPGSQGTFVYAINNKGTTTGWYNDPNTGGGPFICCSAKGKFTFFPAKDVGITPYAINDAGAVAGNYYNSTLGLFPGFVRNAKGGITTFDVTGDQGGTHPTGINTAGAITGYYIDKDSIAHAFVRDAGGGNPVPFDYPEKPQNGTWPTAINASGEIAGYYSDGTKFLGFLRSPDGKTFTLIDVPDSSGGTVPTSINAHGDIAGYYFAQSGSASQGFERNANGNFKTFDQPNAQYVSPEGINSHRVIAGATSISGLNYGFCESSNKLLCPKVGGAARAWTSKY